MTDDKVIHLHKKQSVPGINVYVHAEILYLDELVCLARYSLSLNGDIISVEHVTCKVPKTGLTPAA